MGRETLPCADPEATPDQYQQHLSGFVILNDAAYCWIHKRRFKWQPAKWIEIKPKQPKESDAPTT